MHMQVIHGGMRMNPTHNLLLPVSPRRQLLQRRFYIKRILPLFILRRVFPVYSPELTSREFAELLRFFLHFCQELGVLEGFERMEARFLGISWEE